MAKAQPDRAELLPRPIGFVAAALVAPVFVSLALGTHTQIGNLIYGVETWGEALSAIAMTTVLGVLFGVTGSFIFGGAAIVVMRSVLRGRSWGPGACLVTGFLAGSGYALTAWVIHVAPSSAWALHNLVSGVLGTWPLVENLGGDLADNIIDTLAPMGGGLIAAHAYWSLTRPRAAAS